MTPSPYHLNFCSLSQKKNQKTRKKTKWRNKKFPQKEKHKKENQNRQRSIRQTSKGKTRKKNLQKHRWDCFVLANDSWAWGLPGSVASTADVFLDRVGSLFTCSSQCGTLSVLNLAHAATVSVSSGVHQFHCVWKRMFPYHDPLTVLWFLIPPLLIGGQSLRGGSWWCHPF